MTCLALLFIHNISEECVQSCAKPDGKKLLCSLDKLFRVYRSFGAQNTSCCILVGYQNRQRILSNSNMCAESLPKAAQERREESSVRINMSQLLGCC